MDIYNDVATAASFTDEP